MTRHDDHALRVTATAATGLGHALRMLNLARHLPGATFVVDPETATTLRTLDCPADAIRVIDPRSKPGAWALEAGMPRNVTMDMQFSGNAPATAMEVAALKRAGCTVTVIDSMPPDHLVTAPDDAPDMLVTPYLGADTLTPEPAAARWLHGPDYAILSPDLLDVRNGVPFPRSPRILITCGGSDPAGLSARIVERAMNIPAALDVVLGPMFAPDLKARLLDLSRSGRNVTLHAAPASLVPLYAVASLVVGRPGLTRYEAACLGRNAIYLAEGSPYGDYFEGFNRTGIAEIYIDGTSHGAKAFFARLEGLRDPATLERATRPNERALKAVDGRGMMRVADAIRAIADKEPS
jgi:UDP-2,4-diacetamido-2,4,6-trideoxy-beta-L-altropyranose hydrolase